MPRSVLLPTLALAALLPAGTARAAGSAAVHSDHLVSRLVAEYDAAIPGAPLRLGLLLEHAPHWHTYWRNPGDSGLPTRLDWSLPEGVRAGAVEWPLPQRFAVGPLVNFGYEGRTLLPVAIELPADFAAAGLVVDLHAQWLICREECIPGEGRYRLELPVGSQAAATPWLAAFMAAAERQPLPPPDGVTARFSVNAEQVDVFLSGPLPAGIQHWTLFPASSEVIDNAATPSWFRDGDGWQVRMPRSPYFTAAPAQFDFVLGEAGRGLQISALPQVASAADDTAVAADTPMVRAVLLVLVSLAALAAILLALRRMSPRRPSGQTGDRR